MVGAATVMLLLTLACWLRLRLPAGVTSPLREHRNGHHNDNMVRQVTATEARTRLLSLLDDVAGGDEIEITRHGRTVARLVPADGPAALRGRLAGVARTTADDGLLFMTGAGWECD